MQGAVMLESGYFTSNAIHNPLEFWRRLKMSKEVKIFIGVQEYDDYFRHRKDRSGLPRFTSVALLLSLVGKTSSVAHQNMHSVAHGWCSTESSPQK
jgi:hypothetical protein